MRSILVPLFYLWLAGSIVVLARRKFVHGSFRPEAAPDEPVAAAAPLLADPPPPIPALIEPRATAPDEDDAEPGEQHAPADAAVAVDERPTVAVDASERCETLADALSGIHMPAELMPLITGRETPRVAVFSTTNRIPAAVGTALADEFERLGYALTPVDDRTIDATRGADHIQISLTSAELDSPSILSARYPTAHADALVVEFRVV